MSFIRILKPVISDIQEQALSMLVSYTEIIVKYMHLCPCHSFNPYLICVVMSPLKIINDILLFQGPVPFWNLWIIIYFWESAHLPLPQANTLP